jgi:hypothetical protein
MKKIVFAFSFFAITYGTFAQGGHDIRINFKNC